jgi:hypothetical protein
MGLSTPRIDFDGPALNLYRSAYDWAYDHQRVRDNQCERDYQLFHGFVDMVNRDATAANVAIPRIFSILHSKVPRKIRALYGRRPYLPFDSYDKTYSAVCRAHSKVVDFLLHKGRFRVETALAEFMAALYGTSFVEIAPYYEDVVRPMMEPNVVYGYDGTKLITDYRMTDQRVKRLRYLITPMAQWEVKVDPFAVGLEREDQCRYVVKIQLASRRQIIRMAERGDYGKNFDVDKLRDPKAHFSTELEKHRGLKVLAAMGIQNPSSDGDMGVLFRYESPERYIDVWNDAIELRDGDNPYSKAKHGHGLINLSRIVHNIDPHTQTKFWGDGDGKYLEMLSAILNDLMNMALNNHMGNNLPRTFYRTECLNPNLLSRQFNAQIPVSLQPGESIDQIVRTDYGKPLPADHYKLREVVDGYMDQTAGNYEPNRGEPTTGQHTLGELILAKQAGDSREELTVAHGEDLFLVDLLEKCLCHNAQWLKADDRVEILGAEGAADMIYDHPGYIPGGYKCLFTGSDQVMKNLVRQDAIIKVDQRLSQSPYRKEGAWMRTFMTAFDLGDEAEECLYTDEEMAALQQGMVPPGAETPMPQEVGGPGPQPTPGANEIEAEQTQARSMGEGAATQRPMLSEVAA